jgi:hypothetical protein
MKTIVLFEELRQRFATRLKLAIVDELVSIAFRFRLIWAMGGLAAITLAISYAMAIPVDPTRITVDRACTVRLKQPLARVAGAIRADTFDVGHDGTISI